MEKKTQISVKDAAVVALFLGFLLTFLVWNLLTPDAELSYTERRHLKQLPEFTSKAVFSAEFSQTFEEYALDQFVLRDSFRTLKATFQFEILRVKDNNKIYISEGSAAKLEYPLKEASVTKAANKFNALRDRYFPGNENVYYAIIPDKNYFLASKYSYPSMDYARIDALMRETTTGMTPIPLYDTLQISDYYTTDTHWRQECLGGVVNRLGEYMGHATRFDASQWTEHSLTPFYGVYYGQSALPMPADTIIYLTSEATDNARVVNHETNQETTVYAPEKFSGSKSMDGYDVFLHGAAALFTIENSSAASNRELVVFRDSFGSSLIPLLIPEYRKITVIDIRYVVSNYITQFVSLPNNETTDILFLYNAVVLNNSDMLR